MRKIFLAAVLLMAAAGAGATDLPKLVQDTQRTVQEPSKVLMVWWIPTEFWGVAMQGNPAVTPEIRKQFVDTLGKYLVFAIAAVDVGPMGGLTPRGRPAIEAETQLLIDGKKVPVLAGEQISPDALNFVSLMKPMMANMLGQFGQGIEFLLYPNPVTKDSSPISATGEGRISYAAFGHDFDWKLPLGSLLEPKFDKATGEQFPGDYKFSPYTGNKLESK